MRSSVWSVLLALGITATVYMLMVPDQRGSAEVESVHGSSGAPEFLIPFSTHEWRAVELVWRGSLQRFARDRSGVWYLDRHAPEAPQQAGHTHTTDTEAASRIDKALGMLGRARVDRVVERGEFDRTEYGLVYPPLIVMVYGAGPRPLLTLNAGDVAPDRLSRYLHVVEHQVLVTVPDFHVRNLLTLLASFGVGSPG